MNNYEEILKSIRSDPAYGANLDWGKPRSGHPEGSIRNHIEELEANLERLAPHLSTEEIGKLRVLIHTHDTFKPNAKVWGRDRRSAQPCIFGEAIPGEVCQ